MINPVGFDNVAYINKQKTHIMERISRFQGKLYLEFGGKLFDDYHASRVLPGFDVNGKIKLLYELREQTEIIICVSAIDIAKNKMRADHGISYEMDVLRLIDDITNFGISVNCICITRYTGQPNVDLFMSKLKMRSVKFFVHHPIAGYPYDIEKIVCKEGFGSNPFIETTKPLVVVTAPGPGSGKLATCLNQIYHEHQNGVKAGYAKFETFPIWNLNLMHPVNLAYEAATADLDDINVIDSYHLEKYNITTVNYNRDIDAFPIVKTILGHIFQGQDTFYYSPTDMGVNMAGMAIINDEIVREAACQEIIRRYFKTLCEQKMGVATQASVEKIISIMHKIGLKPEDRPVYKPAQEKCVELGVPTTAMLLPNGKLITGRNSELMTASAGVILNGLKSLAGIGENFNLIVPIVLEPMMKLKRDILGNKTSILYADEILSALCISAVTNTLAAVAVEKLSLLRNCELHSSHMLERNDEATLRKLGVRVTSSPEFPSKDLFF